MGRRIVWAFVAALFVSGPTSAADMPLLLSTVCKHAKLGTVEVTHGPDITRGVGVEKKRLPAADYASLLARLEKEAAARGANAIVLRGQQALFLTKKGKTSPTPVRVELRAAAIRLEAPDGCELATLTHVDLEQRALQGDAELIEIEFDSMSRPLKKRPYGMRSRVLSQP